ncbi:MAG: hypothetical protein ABW252_20060 [Polyangiales bacterium]
MTTTANEAEAQARQAVAISGAPAALHNAARPLEDDRSTGRDKTPMGGTSIGLNVGMAGMGAGKYTLEIDGMKVPGTVSARRGVYLSLPLHVGGEGFAWTFAPFLARSSVEHDLKDGDGNVTGAEDVALTAYGLYTGPVYNVHVKQPLYLGVGLGLKAAYISNPAFEYAADAYARVPLSATYYVSDQLAIVAETGFGYGVSAFIDKPNVVGADDAAVLSGNVGFSDVKNTEDDPQFGKAFAWDFAVGIRLP